MIAFRRQPQDHCTAFSSQPVDLSVVLPLLSVSIPMAGKQFLWRLRQVLWLGFILLLRQKWQHLAFRGQYGGLGMGSNYYRLLGP